MTARPNLYDPAWDREVPAPFSIRQATLARQAGCDRLGASVYEIAPGGAVGYLHRHARNEELVIALSGTVTVRTATGAVELEPGELVAFPTGEDGTHQLVNRGELPARALVCSTMDFPDVVEHVELERRLVCTGPREIESYRRADAVRPFSEPPLPPDWR